MRWERKTNQHMHLFLLGIQNLNQAQGYTHKSSLPLGNSGLNKWLIGMAAKIGMVDEKFMIHVVDKMVKLVVIAAVDLVVTENVDRTWNSMGLNTINQQLTNRCNWKLNKKRLSRKARHKLVLEILVLSYFCFFFKTVGKGKDR
jgi:hypothetical protein